MSNIKPLSLTEKNYQWTKTLEYGQFAHILNKLIETKILNEDSIIEEAKELEKKIQGFKTKVDNIQKKHKILGEKSEKYIKSILNQSLLTSYSEKSKKHLEEQTLAQKYYREIKKIALDKGIKHETKDFCQLMVEFIKKNELQSMSKSIQRMYTQEGRTKK